MTKWYASVALIAVLTGLYFYSTRQTICPEDFANPNEKIAAFDAWTKDFYARNPNASETELANARIEFYQQNHCQESLKRVQDFESGNVDPATRDAVETEVNRMRSP